MRDTVAIGGLPEAETPLRNNARFARRSPANPLIALDYRSSSGAQLFQWLGLQRSDGAQQISNMTA
jgi:hypothetical protein